MTQHFMAGCLMAGQQPIYVHVTPKQIEGLPAPFEWDAEEYDVWIVRNMNSSGLISTAQLNAMVKLVFQRLYPAIRVSRVCRR